MKVLLMNSAMMPADGIYCKKSISVDEWIQLYRKHVGNMVSYIGYPDTAILLRELTGDNIAVSREITIINDGDLILGLSLNYRIAPGQKKERRRQQTPKDYNFFVATYKAS